jgi:hypothetical protein
LSSETIGPLNTAIAVIDDVELARGFVRAEANARIAGKYSGLAPAMTALIATVSTVYCHSSRPHGDHGQTPIWPTISSGLRLV